MDGAWATYLCDDSVLFFFFGKISLSDLVHPFDNSATLFLMKHVNAHLSTYSTCKSISYLAYRIFKNDKELG